MKKQLIRLSEKLNIKASEFTKRGVLNPSVNGDTELFIDPRLLKKSKCKIFNEVANKSYCSYFEDLAEKVKATINTQNTATKEKMRKNLIKYLEAPDLDGLCLGYADGNPGRGVAGKNANLIMENAIELYENSSNPIVFSLLHLLTAGIGADYIGDITSQIIRKQIYEYTELSAKEIGLRTEEFELDSIKYMLPKHPSPPKKKRRTPILLVPMDILNPLPVEANFDAIFNGFLDDNELIRTGVNQNIAAILQNNEEKKDKQEKIFNLIKQRSEISKILGDYVEKLEAHSYNYDMDKKGFFLRDKLSELVDFEKFSKPQSDDFESVVDTAINEFKKFIDKDNDAKRLLLWKNDSKHQPETFWQKMFQIFVHLYLEKNNIDLSPEPATGVGFVDFKASKGSEKRILVEMKLSKNVKFKEGLTNQLEAYKECFNNMKKSYYIYIDLEKDPAKSNQKRAMLAKLNKELGLGTNLIFINGRFGPSASKI